MHSGSDRVPVAVIGATGYTGAELLRLLLGHPRLSVTRVVGQSRAGRPVGEVLPSLRGVLAGNVQAYAPSDIAKHAEVAFCALPHGASAPIVAELRQLGLRVWDLSADFRLQDAATYEQWYGPHGAPDLFGQAIYGLVELHREPLRKANLVAVPGCFPTSAILPVAPLLSASLISADGLIVDAKSGASGAGRNPKLATHLPEVGEGIRAYKSAGRHRHVSEMEQELSRVAGQPVVLSFTPHLAPMSRGILSTVYATPTQDVNAERCTEAARAFYRDSPSVVVLDPGEHPDTVWVRGSNRVHISYTLDPRANRLVAQAALDNLVKGAGGQAIQALNVRYGWPEDEGLSALAPWP